MKRMFVFTLALCMLMAVGFAEVNVTFRANTSMIRGITDTTGFVDLRGPHQVGDPIHYEEGDWTGGESLTNVGGDYWETTFTFPDSVIDSTFQFKFGANIVDPLTGETASYWENDAPGGEGIGNRTFVIPSTDTTLQMGYVGHPYGTTPFEDPDAIEVRFRVNMEQQANLNNFDPATQTPHIAGNFVGWSHEPLHREDESLYYDTTIVVSSDLDSTVAPEWKFTYGAWDGTEEGSNRFVDGVTSDTTIQWKWYNDEAIKPVSGDTISLTFKTDLSNTINNNGFDPTEDSLAVRVGYDNTASPFIDTAMVRESAFGYVWEQTIPEIVVPLNETLFYQYYKISGEGDETREIYFNFDYPDKTSGNAERRAIVVTADGQVIEDNDDSNTSQRRMPRLQNTNPVSQDVEVAFELDLRPAYYQVAYGDSNNILEAIQSEDPNVDITDTSQIESVYINGPATGGWGWGAELSGDTTKMLYDDGTHGDAVAGDTIFTRLYTYGPDSSNNSITQECKFGINGYDNEGGFGNNHYVNIDDAESTDRIRIQWGSINPKFYYMWDYNAGEPVAIENGSIVKPEQYSLYDNYPNPFNPTTTIEYTLPKSENVTISIYNLVGELVNRVNYSNKKSGQYQYIWNSKDMHGNSVPSGVYFYELNAGKFHSVKKMVLIK